MNSRASFWKNALLISGLLFIAVNLRPAITGIAPLSERIQASGVGVGTIGLLTTIPLILFGLAGVIAGPIGNRFGFARAIGGGMVILAVGCFLRSSGFSGTDLERIVGSILIGGGIAFGNVLMPGLVKSRFPNHIGLMTSLYSTGMNLGGSFGIGFAVPLAIQLAGGWNSSLSFWGYAALFPLLIWIPQLLQKPTFRRQGNPFTGIIDLLSKRRAWQVTAQMGLQSLLFYSCVAWLPKILLVRGMTETQAYGWPTAMQLSGCVASLIIPTLAGRSSSQSLWTALCAVSTIISICGILWLPLEWVGIATIGLGLGLNAGFSMALLVIAMRSKDAETAGNLSSMSQSVGYICAAPFPWLIGMLSGALHSWTIAYGLLLIPAVLVLAAGILAGKPGHVR